MTNDELWKMSCEKITRTANAILESRLGIIEGARKLAQSRFEVQAENDPDFIILVGVDSETDHLPNGNAARHWNASALSEKTDEIQRVENHFRDLVFRACRSLIQKYH